MKMEEVNVGGLGVGVTLDIQRTDGECNNDIKAVILIYVSMAMYYLVVLVYKGIKYVTFIYNL